MTAIRGEAVTGKYLSPEPLLRDPEYVVTMASRGLQVPSYAYAFNNPLRYVDRNGLSGWAIPFMSWEAAGPVVIPFLPEAAGAAAVGAAAGAAGAGVSWVLSAGLNQLQDPPAGMPFPAEPPIAAPTTMFPKSEPGCPPLAVPRIIGPVTLHDHCNTIASVFVAGCRRECERRTGLWEECKEGCRAEGREIYEACMASKGG